MGFPPGWKLPLGSRNGLRAVGNAVPVPLSAAIMRAALGETPVAASSGRWAGGGGRPRAQPRAVDEEACAPRAAPTGRFPDIELPIYSSRSPGGV